MQRRLFVAALSAVPASLAAMASRGVASAGPLKVLTTHVANSDPDVWAGEARWRLVRESRAFDPAAVALVDPAGRRLGYVPPARAAVLAALLDGGAEGYAERSQGGRDKVDVFLLDSSVPAAQA